MVQVSVNKHSLGQVSNGGARVYHKENFQYTLVPKVPIKRLNDVWFISPEQYQESATFTDAMGRISMQTAFNIKNDLDLVKYIQYDSNGLPSVEYLPFATVSELGYVSDPITKQRDFYSNAQLHNIESDTKAFSITEYEKSPLARVTSIIEAGEAWHNAGKKHTFTYRSNIAGEVFRLESGSDGESFYANGTWPKDLLSVTEAISPEGNKTITYKNASGNVVLVNNEGAKTYYVYDDFDRVVFVIPPKAAEGLSGTTNVKLLAESKTIASGGLLSGSYQLVNSGESVKLVAPFSYTPSSYSPELSISSASNLYFWYKYNDEGKVIAFSQPGKDMEEVVYDKLSRPIMYRDGNLRKEGKWKYIKYDAFGRLAYWGIMASPYTRDQLQGQTLNAGCFENYTSSSGKYTLNQAYPVVAEGTIMEEYVYDTHFSISPAIPAGEPQPVLGSAVGLLTRVRSKVLDEASWVTTTFYYNKQGQLVLSQRNNGLRNTVQRTHAEYSFDGQLVKSIFVHSEGSIAKLRLNYFYAYTPQGQLSLVEMEIPNGLSRSTIASYEYNVLGALVKREVGKPYRYYLQTVDYFYNLRGWLTRINNVDNPGSDLFSQTLHYADGLAAVGASGRYDGLISATEWRITGSNNTKMAYGYQYDRQGRLLEAKYASGTTLTENVNGYNESFTYDSNGNITQLQRNGKQDNGAFAQIDKLAYTYSGNQLQRVTDEAPTAAKVLGFNEAAVGATDYAYDPNGNATMDRNRDISSIKYNLLNLPQSVTVDGSSAGRFTFTYTATGEKLRVVDEAGSRTLYYDGPLTFEGSTLQSIATPEGRVTANGYGSYTQEYFITDNQGNVRVTFIEGPNSTARVLSERHYYPSGYDYLRRSSSAVNHFGYGGKEEYDAPLSWLDFHARMYDPSIARWHVPDPLAAKFAPVSPYSYCMGDPVNFIDPNGMEAYTITDVNDIARFLNYLQSGRASYEQMVAHLTGEGGGGCGGGGGYTSLFYTSDYWIEEVRIVGQRPPQSTEGESWWTRKVGGPKDPITQEDIDRVVVKYHDIISTIEIVTYTIVGTKGLATLYNFVKGLTTPKNPWDELNWPRPPKEDSFTIGNPSRQKARSRGEKSLYDSSGGEWRWDANGHGHGPHWDYKPSGNNQPWTNIFN